jgi:CBS domain-containing protein
MSEKKTLREIMSANPVTLNGDQTAKEAAEKMRDLDIGAVLVQSDGGPLGLLTDRDLVLRALTEGEQGHQRRVGDLCTPEPFSLAPNDTVDEAVRLMREQKVRRVPVLEGEEAVGIVSLGDLAIEQDRRSVLGEISAVPPNN